MFSKSLVIVLKFSKLFKPELPNYIAKTLNLVTNLSLISNKAPYLLSAICSEINAVSNTNLILLQNIRGRYRFSLKTVAINWKKVLQPIMSSYMWSFMSFKLLRKYK